MISSDYNVNLNKTVSAPQETESIKQKGPEVFKSEITAPSGDSVDFKNEKTEGAEEKGDKKNAPLTDKEHAKIQNDLEQMAERLSNNTDVPKDTILSIVMSEENKQVLEKTFRNEKSYDVTMQKLEYKYSKLMHEKTKKQKDGSEVTSVKIKKEEIWSKTVNSDGTKTEAHNIYYENGQIKERVENFDGDRQYNIYYDKDGNDRGMVEYEGSEFVHGSYIDENGEYHEYDKDGKELTE